MCNSKTTHEKTNQVSVFNDSCQPMDNLRLSPGKNLLFCNIFMWKYFSQAYIEKNICLGSEAAVNWWAYCGQVCEKWFFNQKPTGGAVWRWNLMNPNLESADMGMDGTLKVFGCWGVKKPRRRGKKKNPGQWNSVNPLIQHLVLPGCVIHTDWWRAYNGLSNLSYTHKTVTIVKSVWI